MSELSTVANALVEIVVTVGRVAHAKQNEPRVVDEKARADLVTDVDKMSEHMIKTALADRFPGAKTRLEESGDIALEGTGSERLTFVVDPIDGTTNYAAGNPHYAVSIGVLLDDTPVIGVIRDPARHETFVAVKTEGAWLFSDDNSAGRRLHVSATPALRDTVLATGFPYTRFENDDDNHTEFCALNLMTRGCRRNGAATLDLAWVAASRFDGYWERGLKSWDMLAGLVLVEEAGGTATDIHGGPPSLDDGEVVATNGLIHASLLDVLRTARAERGL